MGNLGGGEVLVIMLVALLVLGPAKLPDAARQLGKAVAEFRKVSGGFQRELRAALEAEPEPTPAAQVPSGLPVKDAGWVNLWPLGLSLIITHLGLLIWETRYVSASLAFPGLKPSKN